MQILIIANGLEHTALDMAIARTGRSFRTIYALFRIWKGLFEAVMQDRLEAVLAQMQAPPRPRPHE